MTIFIYICINSLNSFFIDSKVEIEAIIRTDLKSKSKKLKIVKLGILGVKLSYTKYRWELKAY